RLKQRQQEDYRELDSRISPDTDDVDDELGAVPDQQRSSAPATIPLTESRDDSPAVAEPSMSSRESQILLDPALAGDTDPRADREQYEAAYDLLRRRRVDDAAQAFQAYVDN